jgi:DNA-binding PadR family transcriptional regulator
MYRILVDEYTEPRSLCVAKRRKVNNLLGLAVLSTVIERPMHPYEIASLLKSRGKERDMNIKWGSFYTVVQNLEKHGFLEATDSERQGGRPERTVYRLTEAGREELTDWIEDLVASPQREVSSFEAALSVIGILPPDDAIRLLGERLQLLEQQIAADREALDGFRTQVHRLFLLEGEFELAIREAEVSWIRSLLTELADGSLPELVQWRAWHETGTMPTDD